MIYSRVLIGEFRDITHVCGVSIIEIIIYYDRDKLITDYDFYGLNTETNE